MSSSSAPLDRRGLAITAGAFVIWGLVPLFWALLQHVPPMQILGHRMLWGGVLVIGWLLLTGGTAWLRNVWRRPRLALMLAASGLCISVNWGLFIWAVTNGHVVETSLGYFINPLMNVVIGVLLLGERLSRPQWLAVGVAAAGVAWLTVGYGALPWIALTLACSFALYGLLRKLAEVEAVQGLGVESLYLFLPALALVLWGEATGSGHFVDGWGWRTDLLLVLGGALTALPLIGFAYGVRRIPLAVVGLLQYIAPTLSLACGVFVFGEPFGIDRAIGFGAIWTALAIFAADGLHRSRRRAAEEVASMPAEAAPLCDEAPRR
ncbi:EamA family transporter RarD [Coralloluteibacterium thermophilus]|uniref:EamA family transporter RarD n=1 Tax=Coralloluteibacterium thermophilum TaxID=2707049 RepID=A0ABV9NID1_9GAMM